jgi:hypothetical protein
VLLGYIHPVDDTDDSKEDDDDINDDDAPSQEGCLRKHIGDETYGMLS